MDYKVDPSGLVKLQYKLMYGWGPGAGIWLDGNVPRREGVEREARGTRTT